MKARFILSTTIATLLSGAASQAATQTWDGASNSNWDTSSLDWSGANWTNASDAVFGVSGTGTVTLGAAVSANSLTFNNPGFTITGGTLTLSGSSVTANSSATIASVLAGTVGLAKSGTGTLTLTAANTYTGATAISAGTLQLGDGTAGHDGTIASASIVNNASLVYNLAGTTTYSGVISGTGGLTLSGSGFLDFNHAPNTYSGPTIINGGQLQLTRNDSTLGSGSSAVTLANAAIASLNLNNSNWGAFSLSIGSLAGGGASGGSVYLNGCTLTVGTDNTSTTYAGVLQNGSWGPGNRGLPLRRQLRSIHRRPSLCATAFH